MRLRTVRTIRFCCFLLAILWAPISLRAAAYERPPNFIVIFCDNLGYGDVEPFGSKVNRTPHLNRMAREGRRFTHFCVTAGVCTPSRASLMTGCYAQRVGMHDSPHYGVVLGPISPYGLHPDEITIAEVLKQQGYATAAIGKWHLGDQPEFLPTRQGFDSWFGIPYSDDMTRDVGLRISERFPEGRRWPPLPLMENETVVEAPPDRNLLTKRYTERALKFIEENRDRPFLLYMPQAMPGSTLKPFASPAFQGKSKSGPWGDSVEELDWSTGQILDKLVELGIDEQTLVVWTSDNGAPLARDVTSTDRGSNGPLYGRGYTTSEGAFRVPTIMWWPEKIPAGTTCDELATTMDLLPTFARLSGGQEPRERVIDGHDIRPLMFGEDGAKTPYEAFYYYRGDQLQAVRNGPWKLFLPLEKFTRHPHFRRGKGENPLLFHLVDDVGSQKNVADEHPDVVKRLTALAEQARNELGDTGRKGKGQRPAGKVEKPTPRRKAPPGPVKAGFADRDITPAIGMERPGGYGKAFHSKLHDPCKVRAAVFDDGRKRCAIVGIDAMAIPRHLVLACRREIEQKCGIPGNAVMVSASHSHSSGPVGSIRPGEFDHASPIVQKMAYEESPTDDPVYLKQVHKAIVDAVCAANETRVAADCGFGSGTEETVSFNRRFRMRSGYVQTNPFEGNPDIIEPAGPIDPDVGVVAAWDGDGKLIGCLVNFACHATTNPGGISANYICYIEEAIRRMMGDDVVVVFTPGASGDVTQVNNLSPYARPDRERWARLVGGRVGAEAVKVMLSMERTTRCTVDVRSNVLKIKRRPPRAERVERALELVRKPKNEVGRTEFLFAKEIVLLDALIEKEPVVDVEVQAIQIGPVLFVSNPAEYFCQLGLEIKRASPFPLTFPVTLANGYVGYVPTEEAFGPRGGGYETRLTYYSNLIPTAGTLIAEKSIELSKQFHPGEVPKREPHAPFSGSPWSFGSNRPELD